jgi:hypothetical protein
MKISKAHQWLSNYLEDPKILTNPEDFLGPNWEDVINFWLYIDGLSWDEKRKMNDRYRALNVVMRESAVRAAVVAANEVVGDGIRLAAWLAAISVTNWFFGQATYELIASHKLLEQGKSLVSLPLCLKSKPTNQ